MKFILASGSPRRAKLLKEAGIKFDIVKPEVDEIFDPGLSPAQNAVRVAMRKADWVAVKHPACLTLAADTIVVLNGDIMGKPEDPDSARKMLGRLSGKEHEVITGVAMAHIDSQIRWSSFASSLVRMTEISSREIEKYVSEGEPMDKAGAYAIQGGAGRWVLGHTGSFTNIIGLPMEMLNQAISELGLEIKMESEQCRS
ncbi:Septum formation protein Maf [hydrothermal vent metagenome]|uniref:Septum formation protein Maf n=1 Tax=hydrothermal vent metagenome TaxID=652676 RepID=A0A3B1C2R9_9ZZZZ